MKMKTLCLTFVMGFLSIGLAAEGAPSTEIIEIAEFTTSVKRQLEKKGVLKAYDVSHKVTVQLVWSDEDAAPEGQILEDRILSRSPVIELSANERFLLSKALREDSDYQESIASCLCEFQPQLRIVFYSDTPRERYDILISGISHGEVQAFQDGRQMAYARTSHFIPDLMRFLTTVFPEHELTKMLLKLQKTREEANQSSQPTPLKRRG